MTTSLKIKNSEIKTRPISSLHNATGGIIIVLVMYVIVVIRNYSLFFLVYGCFAVVVVLVGSTSLSAKSELKTSGA